jgi:hypothetical protein
MFLQRRLVQTLSLFSLFAFSAHCGAALVDSGPINIDVPNDSDGIYYNVVTGVFATSEAAAPGWDINIFNSSGVITFFWPSAIPNSSGGVGVGNVYSSLLAGALVGASNTFSIASGGGGAANFVNYTTSGPKTLGFRLNREPANTLHYGYIIIDTAAGTGFPATIRRIVYEDIPNTGILVPCLLDVTTSALDVDGNCVVDALSDGLMITRAMLGLTGTSVTNGAIGTGAVRTTWEQIRPYLNQQLRANFLP